MSRYRLPNKQTFELFKRGITKSWYFHKVIFERTNWRLFVASRDKSFFNCLFAERRGEGEGGGATRKREKEGKINEMWFFCRRIRKTFDNVFG